MRVSRRFTDRLSEGAHECSCDVVGPLLVAVVVGRVPRFLDRRRRRGEGGPNSPCFEPETEGEAPSDSLSELPSYTAPVNTGDSSGLGLPKEELE